MSAQLYYMNKTQYHRKQGVCCPNLPSSSQSSGVHGSGSNEAEMGQGRSKAAKSARVMMSQHADAFRAVGPSLSRFQGNLTYIVTSKIVLLFFKL